MRTEKPKMQTVEEGQEISLEIVEMGEKGDGLARVKGFVIFVPKTKKGDMVNVRINKVLKSFAFGEVIDGN